MSIKIEDSKYTFPSLCDAPTLRGVEDAPGERITVAQDLARVQPASAFRQRNICRGVFDADEAFEDAAEILPMLRGQGARHVFPHRPSWIFSIGTFPHFSNDAHGFVEKPRTAATQPGTLSHDGKILTGRAKGDNIHRLQIGTVQSMHVSVVFHFGQQLFRHANGKRLDLRSPYGRDPRHFSG
mgnify:CR=1 FL=1